MYGVHVEVYTNYKGLLYVLTKNELNLHQIKWFELLKDYDMSVLNNPGKAKVVEDALSRMTMDSVSHVE